MAINLEWVEEVLCWVEGETNTMSIKLKDVVNPDRYKGSAAVMLTAKNPSFFDDLENLKANLQDASELASGLAATLDSCAADKEKDNDNG